MLYVLSFLHPLMYFFCNIYAKYFIYVSILWLDPPSLPVFNTDSVEVRCKSHKKSGINTGPREHSELFYSSKKKSY